jgi:hypothetical protein
MPWFILRTDVGELLKYILAIQTTTNEMAICNYKSDRT